jgi:hypothetical protein
MSAKERAALRRAELALAALGLTAVLLIAGFVIDVVLYHGFALHPQLVLAILAAVVTARAAVSLARQLVAQCAFLRRLPVVREASLYGHRVRVLPGAGPRAFCAGLIRPHVYLSEGLLTGDEPELRAVLAHEEHHRSRRDPLRQLLARVVADALRPLPPFASLAERQTALADLAADAASVEALGARAPLASAMVRFEESAGVAPERVDRLLGTAAPTTVPVTMVGAAWLAVGAIAAVVATMLVGNWHPDVTLPLVLQPGAIAAISAPACIAAWRAGAWMRPVPAH